MLACAAEYKRTSEINVDVMIIKYYYYLFILLFIGVLYHFL